MARRSTSLHGPGSRQRSSGALRKRRPDAPQQPGDAAGRRSTIVEAAAQLFALRGFHATGMREIAERVGLLGGSLYHHFESKEQLYLEAHQLTFERGGDQIHAAIDGLADPWQRLLAACVTHINIQTDPNTITAPLMNDLGLLSPDLQAAVIRQRDAYEDIFRKLVDDLPLDAGIDRNIYRISLLVLLNSTYSWFRHGKRSPADIADQFLRIFKHPSGAPLSN